MKRNWKKRTLAWILVFIIIGMEGLSVPFVYAKPIVQSVAQTEKRIPDSAVKPESTVESEKLLENDSISDEEERIATQIVVNTDLVEDTDKEQVIYQSDTYQVLEFDSETEAKRAYEKYHKEDNQTDYIKKSHAFTDGRDNYKYLSWGPEAMGNDAIIQKILEKYETIEKLSENSSAQITVAVLDSGIDYNHEFLKDRIANYQYDFIDEDGDAMDEYFHGTHVAGIIADTTLPNVKINAYRVLDAEGHGNDLITAEAIDQAVADGVDIINMSLGGDGESLLVEEAVKRAVEADVLVVVAAGNASIDVENTWPANIKECITVSALEQGLEGEYLLSWYSNYGDKVDIAAPGSDIYSTVLENEYRMESGTSMACPFTAASLAMLKTLYPDLSAKDLETTLEMNADDIGETGFDTSFGNGMVSLLNTKEYRNVPAPEASLPEGEYADNQTLTLTCSDEKAVIYYTTDGTYPSGTGNSTTEKKYTAPIALNTTTVVHAIAVTDTGRSQRMDWTYYINGAIHEKDFTIEDGIVTKYKGKQSILKIPETIQGQKVLRLDHALFQGNALLKEVYLPDSVTELGNVVFSGCDSLEKVSLGKKVKYIGYLNFYNLISENRIQIELDSKNPYFTLENHILYDKAKENLIYCSNTFYENRTITIPDTVKNVWKDAFPVDENQVLFVQVPASVENLSYIPYGASAGDSLIANAYQLQFEVAKENQYYSSENGILYDKGKETLLHYPSSLTQKCYTMPNTVKKVETAAGQYAAFSELELSSSLQEIAYAAFNSAENLTSVIIPKKVYRIDANAFPYTLKEMIFDGDLVGSIIFTIYSQFLEEPLQVSCYPEALLPKDFAETEGIHVTYRTSGEYKGSTVTYKTEGGGILYFNKVIKTIVGAYSEKEDEDFQNLDIPAVIEGITVETIGSLALSEGPMLHVTIPETVTKLKEQAFANCMNLLTVDIPGSIEEIEKEAFFQCNALEQVTFHKGLKTIGNAAFQKEMLSEPCKEWILPDTLEKIGDGAFANFGDVEGTFQIPDSVTKIGNSAFSGTLARVDELILPSKLTEIQSASFSSLYSTRIVVIPASVTFVGEEAFIGCAEDAEYYLEGDAPETQIRSFPKGHKLHYKEGAKGYDTEENLADYEKEITDSAYVTVTLQNADGSYRRSFQTIRKKDFILDFTVIPGFSESIQNQELWLNGEKYQGGSGFLPGNHEILVYGDEIISNMTFTYLTIDACIVQEVAADSITMKLVEGYTYSIDGGENFQESSKFTGLAADTLYEITVRETDTGETYICQARTEPILPTKQIPTYQVPLRLVVSESTTLEQLKVQLPEGFTLQEGLDTEYDEPGIYLLYLTYTPKDIEIYEIVENIPVKLIVRSKEIEEEVEEEKGCTLIVHNSTQQVIKEKLGEAITLPQNNWIKKGYMFIGWNTKQDGTGTTYQEKQVVSNLFSQDGQTIHLYAKWKLISYRITYQLNGGKNNRNNPETYNITTKTIVLKNPVRKGYLFTGWYDTTKFRNKVTKIPAGSIGNRVLCAKWKKVTVGKGKKPKLKKLSKKKLKISYAAVPGADGYQIMIATNRKFTSGKRIYTTSKKKYTISKWKKKKTYYVKVCAYRLDSAGEKVYGKYSAVKKIKK